MTHAPRTPGPASGLADDQGPIPTFGPAVLNEQGHIVLSDAEWTARAEAIQRALQVLPDITDPDEPADLMEQGMRDIDDARPEGQKLFEGMI